MKKIILLIAVGASLLVSIKILLIKSPFVWPDEAIYADVSENLLHSGRMGTDLWKGIVPGIDRCLCWYPPLMFYSIAVWFKIFGFSIVNQRLLSVALGLGIVIVFYELLKLYLPKKINKYTNLILWIPSIITILLVADWQFSRATRLSRPEIFILFFGLTSLLLFVKAIKTDKQKISERLICFSGFFAGLALITHFLGILFFAGLIIYFLLTYRFSIFRQRNFLFFCFSFLIPVAFWLITVYPSLDILKIQNPLIWARKNEVQEVVWPLIIFKVKYWPLMTVFLSYFINISIFLAYSIIRRRKNNLIPSIFICLSWILATYGRTVWYFVFPVPLVYLVSALLLMDLIEERSHHESKTAKITEAVVMIILAINFAVNFQITRDDLFDFSSDRYSYAKLTKQVLDLVPEGEPVFLSSTPDLYFGFKENGRSNTLYEFPGVTQPKEMYVEYLKRVNWVVFSQAYDWAAFGNFLPNYLTKNNVGYYQIDEPLQNQLFVIKLKPVGERVAQ